MAIRVIIHTTFKSVYIVCKSPKALFIIQRMVILNIYKSV